MKKKIGLLLIILGVIGIISILLVINKGKIENRVVNILAQIKNSLVKEQKDEEQREEGELPIKISYSDLSIDEKIISITKTGNTQEKNAVSGEGKLAKVEVSKKKDETTNIKIDYDIEIKNEGNEAGIIDSIIAIIPERMKVSTESSSLWKSSETNILEYNEKETLKEKENKTIKLSIEGIASEIMGEQISEVMLISSEDANQRIIENETNKKIDKTNVRQEMSETNNYSTASAIISVNTWLENYSVYFIVILIILIIIGIILYRSKKKGKKEESY